MSEWIDQWVSLPDVQKGADFSLSRYQGAGGEVAPDGLGWKTLGLSLGKFFAVERATVGGSPGASSFSDPARTAPSRR